MDGRILDLISREKLADPNSQVFQSGITKYRNIAEASPAFTWMTTSHNTLSLQLAEGISYARLNLKATELGVAMHPMSQVLHEYEEIQALKRGFLRMINIPDGYTEQILVRLGYTEHPNPSPRRDLQDLLLT